MPGRQGHAAAILYTLVESCRLAKVDMLDYFADVLVRVNTHPASRIDELVPANWAKALDRERRAHASAAEPQLA